MLAPIMLLMTVAQASGTLNRSIDAVIESQGVSDLSAEQQEGVRRLVRALLRSSSDNGPSVSARRYLEREGFTVCNLSIERVEGEDWLVVSSGFRRSATKDLPMLMAKSLFRKGDYFCKSSPFGGLNEYITDDGDVQKLLFSKWLSLR